MDHLSNDKMKAVFANHSSDKLLVTVQDSGVGIRAQDQRSIFKMFASLSRNRELNTQGVGLGLFISKHIVEQFDGQLILKSRPGRGSRFTFCFNLEDLEEDQPIQRVGSFNEINHIGPSSKGCQKIIVADDEPFNVAAIVGLMKVLKMRDIEVTVETCHDGAQTVQLVQTAIEEGDPFRYSLIMTDCSMPNMDGYESAKRIRQLLADKVPNFGQQELSIVALTGHTEPEFVKKAEEAGINKVYSKPMHIKTLATLLTSQGFLSQAL